MHQIAVFGVARVTRRPLADADLVDELVRMFLRYVGAEIGRSP